MLSNYFINNLHNSIKKINIVFAIGTDSGKTYTTRNIIKNINLKFKNIFAIKPIISGFDKTNYQMSDNYQLLNALGVSNPTFTETQSLSRYRFQKPLSPDIASWKEGATIDFNQIINFCKEKISLNYDALFIETAGGVCSPCSNTHIMTDISFALQEYEISNLLVVNEYLGAISHTISALRIMNFDLLVFNQTSKEFMESVINHLPYQISIFNTEDL